MVGDPRPVRRVPFGVHVGSMQVTLGAVAIPGSGAAREGWTSERLATQLKMGASDWQHLLDMTIEWSVEIVAHATRITLAG